MDKNKLKVLREAEYIIPKQCDLCVHGQFTNNSPFGTCAVRTYKHEKHSGPERQLSIYKGGGCRKLFQLKDNHGLGDWIEFVERRQFTRNNMYKKNTRY